MSEYSYNQNDSDFTYSSKSSKPSKPDPNFKDELLRILKEKGFVDKLKSQVRQNLISEMAAKESIFKIKNSNVTSIDKEIDIFQHMSLSVIADYMRCENLQYSLSVFVPEIGFSVDKLYNIGEILRILQIDNESEFSRNLKSLLTTGNKGFLWCLIKSVSDYHSLTKKEMHIQTEKPEKFIPISEKMQKLDSQFDDRQREGVLKTQQIFEDRMISYQRELEKRLRQEMNNEIERFKNHEISMLKMKEDDKNSALMKQKSKTLEEEYQSRLTALKERERLSQENVHRLLESQERENYLQRQQLMRDINNIRERELDNKKERDRIDRELVMMKDQYTVKLDDLDRRNAQLRESEMGYELRIQQELNNIRLSEESRLVHKWKEVEVLEARVKEDQSYVSSEKEINEKIKHDLLRRQLLFNEMDIISYPALKEQNQTLHDQIKELKQQLDQQIVINEQDKHKIDCLIKQKLGPNFEQQALTNELDRARDIFKREKYLLDEQKETLEKKLLEEIRQKRMLTDQYSQQNELIETLSRQLDEMKDTSYRNRHGYQSSRSQGNVFNSARINTNRDVSPQSNSGNRRKAPVFENSLGDDSSCRQDWDDFANDAKHRLECLDEETEQVNKTYQQFKNRLANSASKIGEIQYDIPTGLVSESFKSGLQEGRQLDINNLGNFNRPVFSKEIKGFDYNLSDSNDYWDQNVVGKESTINVKERIKNSVELDHSYRQQFSPIQSNSEKNDLKQNFPMDENDTSDNSITDSDPTDNQRNFASIGHSGFNVPHGNISESDKSDIIKLNDEWKPNGGDKDHAIIPPITDSKLNEIIPVDDDPEIDPVVKQYMELVKKKKETEKTTHTPIFEAPVEAVNLDNDISEDIKTESQYSADGLSDKKQNSGRSESDSFW